MSNSTNPYTARRKATNPYNKTNQSLQTGYSQVGDNVEPNPLPYSQLNRPGHTQEAKVVREGLDPTMFDRKTQSPVSLGNQETSLFTSVYPWFLVPRPTSANIIQRQAYNFDAATGGTNMATATYLDICVLNVTRAEGTDASVTAQAIATMTPPQIPANNLTLNPEPVNPNLNQQAGTPNFPTGAGSTIAGTIGTYTPASIGEFYKVSCFGHSEVSSSMIAGAPTLTAALPITYQLWVDGKLMMEWANFQWSPVTPKRDMWNWDVPIFVEKQMVLRIINQSGATVDSGSIEACFAGWSEQKMGFLETDKVQIQNVTN